MGELSSFLDALAADDLHAMPSPQVLERVAELVRVANRIAAELTRTVRHAESTQAAESDGLKTMQSWLRGHARLSPAAASRLVANGRALELLPAVAAGFADGSISAEQVAVVAPVAAGAHLAAAPHRTSTWPGSTRRWPGSPRPSRTCSWAGWCSTTWPACSPTGPNRTRPRAGC